MKSRYFFLLVLVVMIFSHGRVMAQCGPLSTLNNFNNGQSGIMFDVSAITSVNLTQIAMNFDAGTYNILIYGKTGTHVGFQTNAAAWTLLGSVNGWNSPGSATSTLIPITFSQLLCPGQVYAFYVTASNGTGANYTNGTAVGNVWAADANIQIREGTGKAYPFGTSFQPRKPNMIMYYSCMMSCCLPPTMSMTQETCSGACDGTATATVGPGGVAPYTYQWDAAAGNQTTQTATGLCAGTYSVNVTDATGCVASGTVTVTSGLSSGNATINPSGPYCVLDAPVNLTAFDPGGVWSGTGITDPANGTFDPGVAGAGTHTITYTIGGPCGDQQSTSIVVNPQQNASITAVGPFCETDPVLNLTAVDPGGTWSGTGITDPVNGTFNPATAGVGTHTITYTISGSCGDVQTTNITVNTSYDASITPAGPYCQGDPAATLSAVDPGGTWSGNGITDPVNGTFDPATAGVGTHVITYTISGACGDQQTTSIVVDPQLNATITPVGPYCEIEPPLNLTAVDPGGTWSGNGITDPVNGTFDPATAGVGTHTITYTISGQCGDVQTTSITVNTSFSAAITPSGPYCQDDPVATLSAVDPGGTWSGNGITDPVNGTFDPATAGAGIHTITYSIGGVCGDTQTTDITVNSLDDATITPAGPLCLGTSITLSAVTGGGTWSGIGITDPVNGTFDASAAGAGIHTITYTTNGPCPDMATSDIEVFGPLQLQALGTATICDGESTDLSATATGGDGNIIYEWTDQSGTVVGNTANLTVSPSMTTTYTVTVSDGCSTPSQVANVTVTVNPVPVINVIVDNPMGCSPLDVNLTNVSLPQGSSCSWNLGNNEFSNSCGSVSTQYTVSGCYDVTLTVTENGCTNSVTYDDLICVAEEPVADFSFTPDEGTIYNTAFEFTNLSVNADSYVWDFDEGAGTTEENPTHYYPEDPGYFTVCLVAQNELGCKDTLCRILQIVEDIIFFVPNSFTPDNDEFNQTFQPIFTSGYDPYNFNFLILNRWGEIIWESHDPSVGWDGTYLATGEIVETGTYVWKVDFKFPDKDYRIMKTGHVNVLK